MIIFRNDQLWLPACLLSTIDTGSSSRLNLLNCDHASIDLYTCIRTIMLYFIKKIIVIQTLIFVIRNYVVVKLFRPTTDPTRRHSRRPVPSICHGDACARMNKNKSEKLLFFNIFPLIIIVNNGFMAD